jgi:hypothetical protein
MMIATNPEWLCKWVLLLAVIGAWFVLLLVVVCLGGLVYTWLTKPSPPPHVFEAGPRDLLHKV